MNGSYRHGSIREHTIDDSEHDAEAARLRAQGLTYPQIAERQGCAVSTAHTRVARALRAVPVEAVNELRAIEAERIDRVISKAWEIIDANHPVISNGKRFDDLDDAGPTLTALTVILRASAEKRKLFGLDAPTKQTITVITEDVVDAELRRLEQEITNRAHQDG